MFFYNLINYIVVLIHIQSRIHLQSNVLLNSTHEIQNMVKDKI